MVSHAHHQDTDSSYVKDFPRKVTLRIYTGEKLAGFRLSDRSRGEQLKFYPTPALMLGVGVTLRGIGVNIAFKLPFQEGLEDKYGSSRHLDIQVHRYRKQLLLDVFLQHYRGFHLNDKNAVTSIPGPEEYPYFPEMRSNDVGASGLYLFNGRRFSLQSLVNQQDQQLRSAGTWMLGGSLFAHFLSNGDSSLLPINLQMQDFYGTAHPHAIRNYGFSLNLGYGYNLVLYRHWLISLSGDGGLGLGYAETKESNQHSQESWGLNFNGNIRFGGGYNADKWYVGFYTLYRVGTSALPYDQSWLGISQGIFRLAIARRLSSHNRYLVGRED
ncbi:MAG: DUF4421 domain-containing protein [Bacteroidetes bacterium]|nr:DUF4421 domain-containing protein [Bacteroidota bacterium]